MVPSPFTTPTTSSHGTHRADTMSEDRRCANCHRRVESYSDECENDSRSTHSSGSSYCTRTSRGFGQACVAIGKHFERSVGQLAHKMGYGPRAAAERYWTFTRKFGFSKSNEITEDSMYDRKEMIRGYRQLMGFLQ